MNLFAYGTLMWPEVLESVIGRHLDGVRATLGGYQRRRIIGEHYPAIIPASGEVVDGILYENLTEADFLHLDLFEGEEYDRVTVQIGNIEAQAYVLAERWRHIMDKQPWLPEHLSPEHLAIFCDEYKGWHQLGRRLPKRER